MDDNDLGFGEVEADLANRASQRENDRAVIQKEADDEFWDDVIDEIEIEESKDKKMKVDRLTKNYLTSDYEFLLLYYQIELKKPIDPAAALLYDIDVMLEIANADKLELIKEIEEKFIDDETLDKRISKIGFDAAHEQFFRQYKTKIDQNKLNKFLEKMQ